LPPADQANRLPEQEQPGQLHHGGQADERDVARPS
jgi:hypothetical protein